MLNPKINDYILTKDGYHGSIINIIDDHNVVIFNEDLKTNQQINIFKFNILENYFDLEYCPTCPIGLLENFKCQRCNEKWCKICLGKIYTHQNNDELNNVKMCFNNGECK